MKVYMEMTIDGWKWCRFQFAPCKMVYKRLFLFDVSGRTIRTDMLDCSLLVHETVFLDYKQAANLCVKNPQSCILENVS